VWSFLLTPEQDVAAIVEQQKRLKANTLQLVDALTTGSYADLRQALPSVRIVQVPSSSPPVPAPRLATAQMLRMCVRACVRACGQVLHVEDDTAVAQARRLGPEEVDAILLDSGRPSLAIKELGGTGTHDDARDDPSPPSSDDRTRQLLRPPKLWALCALPYYCSGPKLPPSLVCNARPSPTTPPAWGGWDDI
jgi:hypothetical protein